MRKACALVAVLLITGIVVAVCPEGATDCFNCGAGPSGIACTKNCTGKWSERAHAYVACECPQGELCVCYCPYTAKLSDECLLDPSCVGKQLPAVKGVMAYTAKINGKARLIKGGTGEALELAPLTPINPGDTISIESSGNSVTVVFGDSIRTYHGEGEVTFGYDATEKDIKRSMQEINGAMQIYYLGKKMIGQLYANADPSIEKGAMTICGGGFTNPDFTDYISEKQYLREHKCVRYNMESEAVFEVDEKAHTVKVLEGNVRATDIDGKKEVIRTGEQAIIVDGDVGGTSKAKFDYRVEPMWWVNGFENGTCSSTCAGNELQTPFPGCSCIPPSGSEGKGGCASGLILLMVLGTLLIACYK